MWGAGRVDGNHTERQCSDLCFTQFVKLITFPFPEPHCEMYTSNICFLSLASKINARRQPTVAVCICDIFAFWWHSRCCQRLGWWLHGAMFDTTLLYVQIYQLCRITPPTLKLCFHHKAFTIKGGACMLAVWVKHGDTVCPPTWWNTAAATAHYYNTRLRQIIYAFSNYWD